MIRGSDGDTTMDAGVPPALRPTLSAEEAHVLPMANGDELDRGACIGRYLVLALLGRGGMGAVYAAYDPELDRRVALKLLHIGRGSDAARKLLVREARALGKLSHPNVVQVHDVGEHAGDVFVAMELVLGESIGAWCRGTPRPSWQEVLAAYLDAARGLSAAHETGLVHRDVKPANILRGHDGRVRVADFGLAVPEGAARSGAIAGRAHRADESAPAEAAVDETLPAPVSSESAFATSPGAVLGTPLYMAPEQHASPDVTPASDQYSFCIALYEGLYGAVPFDVPDGKDLLARLLAQKKQGLPPAPPARSSVPAWVHAALVRGLAFRPEDRYLSMPALIAAFGEDAQQRLRARRRRIGLGAAAAIGFAAALGWARSSARTDPCAHAEREFTGAWDEGIKRRMRAAFVATGRSYAESTAARVSERLDTYAVEWSAMRGEVCRASRGGRPEILALRDVCLDRRRGRLQALTAVLSDRPDVDVLDKAVQAASALYPIATCADIEALTARVRPPEEPAVRARVAALQPRVDQLEALHTAGRHKQGLALGEPLLAEVSALPYPPLRAEVQYWVGRLRAAAGDYAGARAALDDAALSAAEGHDDVLEASTWAELLFLVSENQQRLDEAAVIHELGRGPVARALDERAQAAWLSSVGAFLGRKGAFAESKAAYARVIALREKTFGPDHPLVGVAVHNLGSLLNETGEWPEARAMYERALAIKEKTLGPEHPSVALSLNNLGVALRNMGRYAEASAAYERALAIWERTLGPDHPRLATALTNLGEARCDAGNDLGAIPLFERALALRQKALGPDHPDLAYTLDGLGRAKTHLGQLDAAQLLLERALALKEKALGSANPEVAGPLLSLGELALARDKPDEARALLERALSLHAKQRAPLQLALAEALWRADKDRPLARTLAEEARAIYAGVDHRPGMERATRWLAEHAR